MIYLLTIVNKLGNLKLEEMNRIKTVYHFEFSIFIHIYDEDISNLQISIKSRLPKCTPLLANLGSYYRYSALARTSIQLWLAPVFSFGSHQYSALAWLT